MKSGLCYHCFNARELVWQDPETGCTEVRPCGMCSLGVRSARMGVSAEQAIEFAVQAILKAEKLENTEARSRTRKETRWVPKAEPRKHNASAPGTIFISQGFRGTDQKKGVSV